MTAKKAITMADGLRMNAISEEQKYSWLYELEGQVAEVLETEIPENPFPEDAELLMPAPYENIYVYYLCAMIDYFQQELNLYANDMTMFNSLFAEAGAWWRRNNRPSSFKKDRWRVM